MDVMGLELALPTPTGRGGEFSAARFRSMVEARVEPGGEPYAVRQRENPPEESLDNKRSLALVTKALDAMPGQPREAFVLFELEELGAVDVARFLRIPVGTVASRVRRARALVRQRLTEGGPQ
jgi:RNA polymerase sigma-70 factor (ECF subfamily)